jgi:hypothetical protein
VELFHEAQSRRVPFGLVPDLKELFELPPHRRGARARAPAAARRAHRGRVARAR